MAAPRSRAERIRDTIARLEHDVDAWVATAGPEGPHLVPLSFRWDGASLLIATVASSPTARNLLAHGTVRLGIGPTRDVVMVEGSCHALAAGELSAEEGDGFAAATGFDPRTLEGPYVYFRVRPRTVQAWREANELAGRTLMAAGQWLSTGDSDTRP